MLAEMKDAFVPSVGIGGGAGKSYGITLSVPTILTVTAQSLVFNYQQRDFIRSSRLGLKASLIDLSDARSQVEEDTAITFVSLSFAQTKQLGLEEQRREGLKLTGIMEQRSSAGLESRLDVEQTRRNVLQARLDLLEMEDECGQLRSHLGQLIGIPPDQVSILPESVPAFPFPVSQEDDKHTPPPESPQLLSAEANAKSKYERALGDARYVWRPQVSFFAQYGRVSPINDVSEYYNLHGNYNTAAFGLQVQIPLLDAAHKARAAEAMTDAIRSLHEVELLRGNQTQDRIKLLHTIAEMAVRVEIAEADRSIAQEHLKATTMALESGGYDGRPTTPKDEQTARISERQRYVGTLDAILQLRRTQVYLMRQTGDLEGWLRIDKPAVTRTK